MLGIFGGTFDPVHHGHLRTALEVAEHFGLTDMRLVPGKAPPHRPQPEANPAQRLAMVQLAIGDAPCLGADDRELQREGYSYSVDTLVSFRQAVGKNCPLLFVLGLDAFLHFQSWHRWETILQLTHLVVVQRPGYSLPPVGWYAPLLSDKQSDLQIAASGRVYPLDVTALDISATDLRKRLKRGKNPRYLLPDAVIGYIQTHQLYK